MPDLEDGESTEMQGSGAKPYILKNTGGVYSCSCPAWRNQSIAIEKRTCKHLRKLRGDSAEEARVGGALPQRPAKTSAGGEGEEDTDFAIGTGFSDREREHPPAIGATVTFRYQELSDAGVPRFPSWVGVRVDANNIGLK